MFRRPNTNTNIIQVQIFGRIRLWIKSSHRIWIWILLSLKISLIQMLSTSKISSKYEYKQHSVWKYIWIQIQILFSFWKAPNNLVFEYVRSKLFEYIPKSNYSLTSVVQLLLKQVKTSICPKSVCFFSLWVFTVIAGPFIRVGA